MKITHLAAIDIGTNAVRLLISNIEESGKWRNFKKAAYLRVPVRLGQDVFLTGTIEVERRRRLVDALKGFSYLMPAYNVERWRAYATSAMRDATNGEDIITEIQRETGIKVEIISGKLEAQTICAAGGFMPNDLLSRCILYVDVGGGSTEFVVWKRGIIIDARSFNVGTVRMLNGMVTQQTLRECTEWLESIRMQYAPNSIVASGGNINKIYKMFERRHGEPLTETDLNALYDTIRPMSFEQRIQILGLNDYRADVIEYALKIFREVCRATGISQLYVPKVGLVDGIIHKMYADEI